MWLIPRAHPKHRLWFLPPHVSFIDFWISSARCMQKAGRGMSIVVTLLMFKLSRCLLHLKPSDSLQAILVFLFFLMLWRRMILSWLVSTSLATAPWPYFYRRTSLFFCSFVSLLICLGLMHRCLLKLSISCSAPSEVVAICWRVGLEQRLLQPELAPRTLSAPVVPPPTLLVIQRPPLIARQEEF